MKHPPQYCCYYGERRICLGLIGEEEGIIQLGNGKQERLAKARVLFQWGDDRDDTSAALEELRQREIGHRELLEGKLSAEEEQALEQLRWGGDGGDGFTEGEVLTTETLLQGLDVVGWQRACWFWVLSAGVFFKRQRDGWLVLSKSDSQQLRLKKAIHAEQKIWMQQVKVWLAGLNGGEPLPEEAVVSPSSTEGFQRPSLVVVLRSLLVADKASEYWQIMAVSLGLKGMEGLERQQLLAGWLRAADCWSGWPDIWMERANLGIFSASLLESATQLASILVNPPNDNRSAASSYIRAGRHLTVDSYTFDSSSTKDYDDAIAIEKASPAGVVVVLSIAAPAALITAHHPLMEEVFRRASSLYHPAGCVPMLPLSLSEERSSLKAGCLREAISFRLELSPEQIRLLDVFPSWVKVTQNYDYQQGAELLKRQGSWGLLANICQKLADKRLAAGAHSQERYELHVDASQPQAVRLYHIRRDAPIYRMVEELAISCNALAADYCHQQELPVCYRVQKARPKPQQKYSHKYQKNMQSQVLPDDKPSSQCSPQSKTTQPMRLSGARYSLEAAPHAGLACQRYLQLTAPLRRGLDLYIQQQLLAHLGGQPLPWKKEQLQEMSQQAERRIGELNQVRNNLEKYWKLVWLEQNTHQPLTAKPYKSASSGIPRVWLPQVELAVQLRGELLPEGDPVNVRLLEVDKLRLLAWVTV